MNVLFDTSVLVAALIVDHPKHSESLPWLRRVKAGEIQGFISTHTLAELYAVLTRLPLSQPIAPTLAQRLIEENLDKFQKVVLTAEDYQITLVRLVRLNIIGGSIYDGLIAQAALKANVDILLTLNPKHFNRLGDEVAQLVQVPT
ncbi:PIN domain-containing protein [Aliterella atlantica]|uniref:Ribonuclease VapC n=1 Tax=Aliterella atlantica CENA595 TaxID=1618023 RepID=A0A0D8ZS94_9CYAN|nr:PIN domain-containing protein [Aliterella atlantica]KJH71192.1 twitching motility protein PilT [Aliterella atlantica CENA595]